MSAQNDDADDDGGERAQAESPSVLDAPSMYRCSRCRAPIADVVIAARCETCGRKLGDGGYLEDSVSAELLEALADDTEGCLKCGGDGGGDVFCSEGCSEEWFAKYTDAYLR